MKKSFYKKGLVFGIIALFVGVALAPGITATIETSETLAPNIEQEALDNGLVEITVEVGNSEHKAMLTLDQAKELENLINCTKARLDATTSGEETVQIFDETVISLYELGMLPNGMSIEEAQRLVNDIEQDQRIVKKLEQRFSRNKGTMGVEDNFLCLITGHTDVHVLIGPSLIPSLILVLILGAPSMLLEILFNVHTKFISFLMSNLISLNFFTWGYSPLAFGYIIALGHTEMGIPGVPPPKVPAQGWINTIGLNGVKNWNDNFFGGVLGFTGIKICYPPNEFMTYFYMGAALIVDDDY